MKTAKTFFAFVIFCAAGYSSQAGQPDWLSKMQSPAITTRQTEAPRILQTPPVIEINKPVSPIAPPAARRGPDECRLYKRHEIAGWTLLGIGAGSIGAGSYLIYTGVTHILNTNNTITVDNGQVSTPPVSRRDITFIGVGSGLGLLGLILVPTGLSMGISGAIHYHHNCQRSSSYLIAPSVKDGLGVAATF